MAAHNSIQILTGPSGSARAARIDTLLRESNDTARLLVPSAVQARARREAYLAAEGYAGAWGMPVWSLTDFAEHLLMTAGVAVTRLRAGFQERLLVEQYLEQLRDDLPDTYLAKIPVTPGLVRHLLMVMNDLKQAAIDPEVFSARIGGLEQRSSFDEGVAAVYKGFHEHLRAHGLFDVPGLYWLAEENVRNGKMGGLDGVDTLLFDGFDDFTPSEFRLLEALAANVSRVVIGLNLDPAPDRQDRYTVTRATLAQLQNEFHCQVVACEAPEPVNYSGFAARHIFWREEPALPEGLAPNLAIVPCSDSVHELETVARRVKTLLVEQGVAPDDIAVVHWSMSTIAATLRRVFQGVGVPCQVREQRPLSQTGLGRTLVNLFCNTDTWERDGILDLLASPHLRMALWGDKATRDNASETGDPPAALRTPVEAAAYYMRQAQVMEGYKDTGFRINRLRDQLAAAERKDAKAILKRRPDAVAEVEALLAALENLKALQEGLERKGTALFFARKLDAMLGQLDHEAGDPEETEVLADIRALLELLAEDPEQQSLTRAAFLERFSQGMDEMKCTIRGDRGGVACLDPEGARNRRFAHVFVIGLMEGQVPATPVTNSIYPEHDRERLHKAGIPLETNQEHHARQRMLFGHVLECASDSLTLSWPLTQESGRESSPSPFLTDVRELFPESAGVVAAYPRADSFLPEPAELSGPRDVTNRALYDAPALLDAFPDWCGACSAGAAVEDARHSAGMFDHFDGALQDPELIAAIASEYGSDHEFSVAQLEAYLSCPFSFFTRRILHLEDTEMPEAAVTPLMRGDLLHQVLQRFHKHFAGMHVRDIGLEKCEEVMAEIVEDIFADAQSRPDSAAPPAAWHAEKAHLMKRLIRYLEIEFAQEGERDWKAAHFELAFGRACSETDDGSSNPEPFVMMTDAGEVRFTGKVDRVDVNGKKVRLIDYKSGGVPQAGEITRGESIQLSVYAEAVSNHILPGTECTEARYLSVGKTDRREALGIGVERHNWPEREPNMNAAILRAVLGIRRGYFPPVRAGKSCYGCGHARACRHEEARIARKLGIEKGEG